MWKECLENNLILSDQNVWGINKKVEGQSWTDTEFLIPFPLVPQVVSDPHDVPHVLRVQCAQHGLRLAILHQPLHRHQQQRHHIHPGALWKQQGTADALLSSKRIQVYFQVCKQKEKSAFFLHVCFYFSEFVLVSGGEGVKGLSLTIACAGQFIVSI